MWYHWIEHVLVHILKTEWQIDFQILPNASQLKVQICHFLAVFRPWPHLDTWPLTFKLCFLKAVTNTHILAKFQFCSFTLTETTQSPRASSSTFALANKTFNERGNGKSNGIGSVMEGLVFGLPLYSVLAMAVGVAVLLVILGYMLSKYCNRPQNLQQVSPTRFSDKSTYIDQLFWKQKKNKLQKWNQLFFE